MKKNKLLVSVTTTKIYEYNTEAETEDVAFDEVLNQTPVPLKLVEKYTAPMEIYKFIKKDEEFVWTKLT